MLEYETTAKASLVLRFGFEGTTHAPLTILFRATSLDRTRRRVEAPIRFIDEGLQTFEALSF